MLEDEDLARVVHPLTMLATLSLILATVYTILWLIIMPQLAERVVYSIFAIIISGLTLVCVRFQRIAIARHVLLNGTWLLVSATILTSGGTRAPIFGLYILIVLVAALLSGWRVALGYAVATIMTGLVLAIIDPEGDVFLPFATPMSAWLSQTSIILIVSGAAYFILRRIEQSLQQAQDALAKLEISEIALRESEERYRLISTITSDYTFSSYFNAQGVLEHTLLTGAFEEISGYTPDEFLAIGWRSTIHPDDIAEDDRAMALLQENKIAESELRIIRKDGAIRWVRVNAHPVWDSNLGQLVAINGGVRDVTHQIETQDAIFDLNMNLQDKANQLSTINEIARDISAVTDLNATLNLILQKLQQVLPLDVFFVALHDVNTQTVTFPIMYDAGKFWEQEAGIVSRSGIVGQVLQTKQAILVNRTLEEMTAKQNSSGRVGDVSKISASILMIPLPVGEEIIGVFSIQSYTLNSYNEKHVDFLGGAAQQLAIAVQNARLYDSQQSELTKRKRLESELQEYSRKLEKLVEERTQSLRRANEQLELILNNTNNALAFADPDGDVLVTNPAFRAIFAEQNSRAIEFLLWTLDEEEQLSAVSDALLKAMYDNQAQQIETQVLSRNGERKDLALTLVPVGTDENKSRNGVLLSCHDITQMKDIERFKQRFVADAVHDLATPISGLSTRLYLLQRSPQRLNDHVRALENQVSHLKDLLDDLRILSQMDRNQIALQLELSNINDILQRVFDTYEPVAIEKQQSLILTMDSHLPDTLIDPRQIERVFVNLVSNAINYSPENKEITIQTMSNENFVTVTVEDQGIGISQDEVPHVFDRFYRTDQARMTVASGTGLGLAITREIVEKHGGEVEVQSEVGEGSIFLVKLPILVSG